MLRVPGIQVTTIKSHRLDQLGAGCRKRLAPGIAADGQVNMLDVLESFDGRVVPLKSGVQATIKLAVVKSLPPTVLATTSIEGDRIFVSFSDRMYAEMAYDGRARFTGAHEIAHVELHLAALEELKTLTHHEAALARSNPSHEWHEDSEVQANRFAAAFLAPDAGMEALARAGELTPRVVSNAFGLGRTAAKTRIANYKRNTNDWNLTQRLRVPRSEQFNRRGGR